MPIDPSIPLQAGQQLPKFGPDWGVIQNALKTQIAMQQAQQVQQAENALKAAYSDPNNFDPNTLALKPDAMVGLARQAPQVAMDVRNNLLKNQEQEARSGLTRSKILEQYGERGNDIANKARRTYEAALSSGVLQPQAQALAQKVYTDDINAWLPNLPPEIARTIPKDFDIMRARATEQGWKEHQAAQKEVRAARGEERAERREDRLDARQEEELQSKGYTKTEEINPENNRPRTIWVHPSKPPRDLMGNELTTISGEPPTKTTDQKAFKVETTDGKPLDVYRDRDKKIRDYFTDQEVAPDTIKPGSMRNETGTTASAEQARATAEAIYEYRQPPLTSYAMRGGQGPAVMEALRELGTERGRPYDARNYGVAKTLMEGYARTSPQSAGGQMNAVNTAVDHMEQAETLAKALKNRDTQVINRVMNYAQTQMGRPEATNFRIGARIVADEVIKAVVGSGAAVYDREGLTKQLADYSSPEQMEGALKTLKGLMGGRLGSMEKQWTAIGLNEDDWENKLSDNARDTMAPYLKSKGKGGSESKATASPSGATPKVAGDFEPAAKGPNPAELDAIAKALAGGDGKPVVLRNGEEWGLRDGKPVRVK